MNVDNNCKIYTARLLKCVIINTNEIHSTNLNNLEKKQRALRTHIYSNEKGLSFPCLNATHSVYLK